MKAAMLEVAGRPLTRYRFLALSGSRPGRHLLAARNYREIMRRRFTEWSKVTHSDFAIS
jgi:putative transposase